MLLSLSVTTFFLLTRRVNVMDPGVCVGAVVMKLVLTEKCGGNLRYVRN